MPIDGTETAPGIREHNIDPPVFGAPPGCGVACNRFPVGEANRLHVTGIDALLPQRCNEAPAFHTISFFATGMSCGGTIALSRLGAGYEIRVNWLTGGIEIVPRRVL